MREIIRVKFLLEKKYFTNILSYKNVVVNNLGWGGIAEGVGQRTSKIRVSGYATL